MFLDGFDVWGVFCFFGYWCLVGDFVVFVCVEGFVV